MRGDWVPIYKSMMHISEEGEETGWKREGEEDVPGWVGMMMMCLVVCVYLPLYICMYLLTILSSSINLYIILYKTTTTTTTTYEIANTHTYTK
jgi:hypothetical protein